MAYRTIVVDPPWPQKGGGSGFLDAGGASLPMPYAVLPLADIAALPVSQYAAQDAHLYLWTTSGFLPSAFEVVRAWGFVYSTMLVWAKAPIGHGLGGAYGIATEFVLFARRGSLAPLSKAGRNWFDWKRPYDARGKPRHSAKPAGFYDIVEQVSPPPYLELFARPPHRLGWDVWGNESANTAALDGG